MKALYYVDEYNVKNYTHLYKFLISFILLVIVLTGFSTMVWYLEKDVNPKLDTLSESFWYGHAVVTTIGFGDVTPITEVAKWFTIVSSIFGIVLLVSMGQSLNDFLFGHTDTGVLNRELRALLEINNALNQQNAELNEEIARTNLLSIEGNDAIISLLKEGANT